MVYLRRKAGAPNCSETKRHFVATSGRVNKKLQTKSSPEQRVHKKSDKKCRILRFSKLRRGIGYSMHTIIN
jgi:hypothetical protein